LMKLIGAGGNAVPSLKITPVQHVFAPNM